MGDDDKEMVTNLTEFCLLQLTGRERFKIDQVRIPKTCSMYYISLISVVNRMLCFFLQNLLDAAKEGRLADVQVGL